MAQKTSAGTAVNSLGVLPAIAAFAACRTPQDVGAIVARSIAGYGLNTYAIGGMPPPSDPNPTPFTIHNWPAEWAEVYMGQGFGAIDPIPKGAMISAAPFTITELRSGKVGVVVGPECDALFAGAEAMGRGAGLIVPIHGPFGYHGIVTFAGARPDLGTIARAELHLLGLYAHNRMLELFRHAGPAAMPHLTPREVQVLRHLRNGLGDEEIARQTGISTRTVRFHTENARKRLGAKTRTEALLLAANHHLLGA